jgi:hypothetical protein
MANGLFTVPEMSEYSLGISFGVDAAIQSRAAWLEALLAELLSSDIPSEDIEIQDHPDCRTVVCIRGVPRHEWKAVWPTQSSP